MKKPTSPAATLCPGTLCHTLGDAPMYSSAMITSMSGPSSNYVGSVDKETVVMVLATNEEPDRLTMVLLIAPAACRVGWVNRRWLRRLPEVIDVPTAV
jgi:hypothetical protein